LAGTYHFDDRFHGTPSCENYSITPLFSVQAMRTQIGAKACTRREHRQKAAGGKRRLVVGSCEFRGLNESRPFES